MVSTLLFLQEWNSEVTIQVYSELAMFLTEKGDSLYIERKLVN